MTTTFAYLILHQSEGSYRSGTVVTTNGEDIIGAISLEEGIDRDDWHIVELSVTAPEDMLDTIRCSGCETNEPNQQAHMGSGGCLEMDSP